MAGWSREEIEVIVTDYLEMLMLELSGIDFNKAERNRRLQALIGRSKGSIEMKHQNISAVLNELGRPAVDGYKPLPNYQRLLGDVVVERLAAKPELDKLLSAAVTAEQTNRSAMTDLLKILVPPPEVREKRSSLEERPPALSRGKRDYLEMESRNASLGRAGEELILKYECERLWQAGARKLANRIEHVSENRGDGAGFDIHSFETDGRDRLIEVKTTRFGAHTPFFASRNEVEVSSQRSEAFHLYRLYHFANGPKLFCLAGALRKTCELEAVTFQARAA